MRTLSLTRPTVNKQHYVWYYEENVTNNLDSSGGLLQIVIDTIDDIVDSTHSGGQSHSELGPFLFGQGVVDERQAQFGQVSSSRNWDREEAEWVELDADL